MSAASGWDVETDTVSLRLHEGRIEFRWRAGTYVDLAMARAAIHAAAELVGSSSPLPTLVEIGRVRGVTREARGFFADSDESWSVSSRVALVAGSAVARVIGSFFTGLNKSRRPVKLFDERESALRWLESAAA